MCILFISVVLSHVGDRHEVQEDHPKSEDTKQIETGNGHAAISMIVSLQFSVFG